MNLSDSGVIAGANAPGLLGDTPERDYARKLGLFSRLAAPELRAALGQLGLRAGMRALDAGCGAGAVVGWLAELVGPAGLAVGIDLATAHTRAAHAAARPAGAAILQADLGAAPLRPASFDLVWCANTINHLRDPLAGARALAALLHPGGRLALGQSLLLPELIFAWDARLEREVTEACRRYYRERYGLNERDTAAIRALVGLLRAAGLRDVSARTSVIERVAPLDPTTEEYIREAVFRGAWGERVQPYLDPADWATLQQLCDPGGPDYCLRRPDFHYMQTFTVVSGLWI
jgi:SAM-dependent methyltransferase